MKLSVVIPAHNEEKIIYENLERWTNYLNKKKFDYEIIVSEDGSTDKTYNAAKKFANKNKKVKVIHSVKRLGKGGGLINGFKKSTGDIVAFSDADLSANPEQLEKLIRKINSGYDVAIGSRRLKESEIMAKPPITKRIASKFFNIFVNQLFHLNIKDTQCGLKAFSRKAVDLILPNLKTTGFEVDVELLVRAKKFGLSISEIPIKWSHRQETKFSLMKDSASMGKSLMRLWLRERFSKIDAYFLLFILSFFAISLFFLNSTPIPDEGTHNLIAVFFHNFFNDWSKHITFSFSKIYDYTLSYLVHYPKLSLYYPPLFHILLSFFYRIFGVSFWSGGLLTLIFLALTSISIYIFCRKFLNSKTGLLSSILFSLSPLIFINSIRAMTDIPYMLLFMLTMYEFLIAFRSGNKKHYLCASILFSIGFLIKWNILLSLPIVFLYALFEHRNQIKNIFFSFLIILLLLSPYGLLAIKAGFITLPFKSSVTGSYIATQDPQFTSFAGWMFYWKILSNEYLTLPVLLLSVFSLIVYSIRREKFWKLFLLWFFVSYLIFTIVPNKEDRYILPALPALIIPLSYVITYLRKKLVFIVSIFLVSMLISTLYPLLIQSFQFKTDFDTVINQTLQEDGNIVLATEPGWFYSAQFMFRLANLDHNMTKIVFRPCVLSIDSIENLTANGVRYVIVAEPTDNTYIDNINLVKSSSSLYFYKKFETNESIISIYMAKNYKQSPSKEICNYVCILNNWICTNYTNPSDALVGENVNKV